MDNPGLFHVQISLVQPNAAHYTKCSRNLRKFSLNDVHEQTVQRVHQVQADLLSLGVAAPPRRQRGRLGGGGGRLQGGALPSSHLRLPSGGWLLQRTDVTIAAAITTALCRRRRLDAPTKFECQWGPVRQWHRNPTGSLATKHLLVVLGQACLQLPAIIRM